MPSLISAEPQRPAVRRSGWPARRMPRWFVLAIAAFLVAAVAVALVHKPTTAERASDLRGFLQEVTSDIESCAGGVTESLTALHDVQAESPANTSDVSDAISVAQTGAANCEPANNEQIDDLENYQVPESLASFGLVNVVTSLVRWAVPDAANVQADVAAVLTATTTQARGQATAALTHAVAVLNAQRTAVEGPIEKAIKTLDVKTPAPRLPG